MAEAQTRETVGGIEYRVTRHVHDAMCSYSGMPSGCTLPRFASGEVWYANAETDFGPGGTLEELRDKRVVATSKEELLTML